MRTKSLINAGIAVRNAQQRLIVGFEKLLPLPHSRSAVPNATTTIGSRIESIDLLRGIIMIIMALDHVRAFLHFDSQLFSPTDLQRTTPLLFATRLITHLCAPTFIFLAGTSAYMVSRRKSLKETSTYLLSRGLWLIFLQVTIVQFSWNFDPAFHYLASNIISTIGFCMIALAGLIRLPFKAILGVGLVIVVGHNALDGVSFDNGVADVIWSFLHVQKLYTLSNGHSFQMNYPVLPWIGVIVLGYCFGRLYNKDYSLHARTEIIWKTGIFCLFGFVVLRAVNVYGDLHPWAVQPEPGKFIMAFLKVEKYPPSLLFLCFTLGIAMLMLHKIELGNMTRLQPIILFGKAALFYYVLHVFVIHILAMVAAVMSGFPADSMVFLESANKSSPELKGHFGFSLGQVYLIWVGVIVLLYPACKFWVSFKTKNKEKWWVSFV